MTRSLALVLPLVLPSLLLAADPPAPAVEIRIKSIAELPAAVDYAGDLLMQPDAFKMIAEMIRNSAKTGLEGLDTSKPFGAYALITENLADSAIIALVPVKDEEKFLTLLKNQLMIEPKKNADGVYAVEIPQLPIGGIHVRFLNGYAYAAVRNADALDPKKLIAPKDFFAKPVAGLAEAAIHWDRIPADVKKVALGQIELQLVERTKDFGGSELQKQARRGLIDLAVDAVKTIFDDGKTMTLALDANPKTDAIRAKIELTAQRKTVLANNLKTWADRDSAASSAAMGKNPVIALGLQAQLPSGARENFGKLVDLIFDDALADANADAKPLITKLVDGVTPTLKSESVEFGVFIEQAPKSKALRALAAVKTEKGTDFEKILKEFAPFLMGGDATVKFDAATIADRPVHKGEFTNLKLKEPFQTETVWLATGNDLYAFGIEDESNGLKTFLESKPAKRPMLAFEVSAAQFGTLTQQDLTNEKYAGVIENIFGKTGPLGRDTLQLTVRGGESLDIQLDLKGLGFKMFLKVDQEKKK